MKTTCLYILFVILVISCRKADTHLLDNQYGEARDTDKTRIAIPMQDRELTSYQIFCVYKESGGDELLYAYNSYLHALNIFDLTGNPLYPYRLRKKGRTE